MIVWLASYPRSGNTFVRIVLRHLYGVETISKYGDALFDDLGASATVGHRRCDRSLDELRADERLHLVKTHELPEDDSPAVYVVRDGRDALVSHAHYWRSFVVGRGRLGRLKSRLTPFRRTLRQLIVAPPDCTPWGEHVLGWAARAGARPTHIVRFEELVHAPGAVMDRCVRDLELPLAPIGGRVPSFEELHRRWPNFFRRGQSRCWRDEMPARLHELFWEHHGQAMDAMGYERAPDKGERPCAA